MLVEEAQQIVASDPDDLGRSDCHLIHHARALRRECPWFTEHGARGVELRDVLVAVAIEGVLTDLAGRHDEDLIGGVSHAERVLPATQPQQGGVGRDRVRLRRAEVLEEI